MSMLPPGSFASTYDDLTMARDPVASEQPVPAPRARRALAGIINTAILAIAAALWIRRRSRDAQIDHVLELRRLRMLGPASDLFVAQLGSPGGWVAGLRTVDRRTGRPVTLWRTLAVALLKAATEACRRRLVPAPPVPPAISGSEEENVRQFDANRWRWLAAVAVPALINSRLRRRLAPTVVVVWPPRDHSP
jgi:hypothetical protein